MVPVIAIACCVIVPVVVAVAFLLPGRLSVWLADRLSERKGPTASLPTRPESREMVDTEHEGL